VLIQLRNRQPRFKAAIRPISQTQDLLVAYLRPHVEPKTTKS
jgi:hypothetical protein